MIKNLPTGVEGGGVKLKVKLTETHKKRIGKSMRRSWKSGKRRKHRTAEQIKQDRQRNPWEPRQRRAEYRANERRPKKPGGIWLLGHRDGPKYVEPGERVSDAVTRFAAEREHHHYR